MKRMITPLFLLVSVFAAAEDIPVAQPEDVGVSSERLNKITEFAQQNVDSGKHVGIVTMLARDGKIIHFGSVGQHGIDDERPMQKDALFRIFSMTKPITAVALMTLYEDGLFQLDDPVSKYLPAMAGLSVYQNGEVVEAGLEITIEQLLTHTAGLSYGWFPSDPVDALYQEAELWKSEDLSQFVERLGTVPLRYEPGTRYYYSVAFDVQGAVIEAISGMPLDQFFRERIFEPLGMNDTFFDVPDDKLDRFARNHIWNGEENRIDPLPDTFGRKPYRETTLFSGGGGLVSSAMDYMRFCEMMRRGGTFNGATILSPKTVQYMTIDHLTKEVRNNGASEFPAMHLYKGQSFGLGFAVITDPGLSEVVSSRGEYSWGGAADTKFWIDPEEDIVAIVMTQLMRSPWPTRYQMKIATYQALDELGAR